MTDRGRSALRQSADSFTVGPSSMRWHEGALHIDINEMGAPPIIAPVRGHVQIRPHAITDVELPLTPDGAHIWRPFAPVCDIDVALHQTGWTWSGHGYFDANFGTRALEEDFDYWTWGRFPTTNGAQCFYDAIRCDGSELAAGFAFSNDGKVTPMSMPPKKRLKRSLWQVHRETRGDAKCQPRQVMNMLDAPFYSRAMVETELDGAPSTGVYEALDLRRFRNPLLKYMLAVRVPRRAHWPG